MFKILVIEDDHSLRFLMCHWLENLIHDIEITEVSTLLAGIQAAKNVRPGEQQFGLALLDLNLQDYKGLNTLRIFKGEFPNMPVIVVTGGNVDITDAIEVGADDFLSKPFEERELYERVVVAKVRAEVDRMRRLVGDIAQEERRKALERAGIPE